MLDENDRRAVLDQEHLRLLSIGYYVAAGVTAPISLVGILYGASGFFMMAIAKGSSSKAPPPPEFIGWLFAAIGFAFFAILLTVAVLQFMSARRLRDRRSKGFCYVVAGITCLGFPYGLFLGVCTFIVLSRTSVGALFEKQNDV